MTTNRGSLFTVRLIWLAMIVGQVLFAAMCIYLKLSGRFALSTNEAVKVLLPISIAYLVGALPVACFIRSQIYKRHWQRHAVAPEGYASGNIIFLAICESAALLSLISMMLADAIFPAIVPALVAFAVQLVNYPTGRAMVPDPFLADTGLRS